MAMNGQAPHVGHFSFEAHRFVLLTSVLQIFTRISKWGLPYVALSLSVAVGFLSFMSVSSPLAFRRRGLLLTHIPYRLVQPTLPPCSPG